MHYLTVKTLHGREIWPLGGKLNHQEVNFAETFQCELKMLLSLFCTQADTSSFPQLHPWFTQAAADSGLLPPR